MIVFNKNKLKCRVCRNEKVLRESEKEMGVDGCMNWALAYLSDELRQIIWAFVIFEKFCS